MKHRHTWDKVGGSASSLITDCAECGQSRMEVRAREVAAALVSTCDGLHYRASDAEISSMDFCKALDAEVYQCDMCGWWHSQADEPPNDDGTGWRCAECAASS